MFRRTPPPPRASSPGAADTRGSPRRSLARRLLRALVWLGVLASIGPVTAAVFAQTQMGRAYIGHEASLLLRRELGLQARIDEIEVDLGRMSVVAHGIHLVHPRHGSFAQAAELRIRPSYWALMRGQLDLHSITLVRPTVWLQIRDGRIENLPDLPDTGGGGGASLDLPFDLLRIEQARVIADAGELGSGEILNIEVNVNASKAGLLRVRVETAGGYVRHAGGRDPIGRIEARGAVSENAIAVEQLLVESGDVRVSARDVELSLPLGAQYRGHVELDLHVPALLRWPLGLEVPLAGELQVRADLEGDSHGPRGTGNVLVEHGQVDQYGIGERVSMDLRIEPESIGFRGVSSLIRDGGQVLLDGELGLTAGLPLRVHSEVLDVGFAKLMEQLGISPNAIVDWVLAGSFDLKGTIVPLKLDGSLHMPTREFEVLRHAWHAPPPKRRILGVSSAKLDGRVRIDPAGIHLQDIGIELPGSRLNASVLLGFDNALRITAQGLDWNLEDCSPIVDFALGGRGGFELEVDGTFSDPLVRGHVNAREFAFGGFVFGDIDSAFEVDRDLMGVQMPRMPVIKGESRYAVVGGYLDFRQDAFRAGGKVVADKLRLADFYKIFHYDGDERYDPFQATLHGDADVVYTLGHPGDGEHGTMVTAVDVELADAVLDGYAFDRGAFSGSFTWLDHARGYRGGELNVERLWLRKGKGTVSVSGHMAEEGALSLVVLADALAIRELEGPRERLPDLSGSLSVSGKIEGTAALPRAHLDLVGTGLTLRGEPLGDARAYVRLTDKEDPWIAAANAWKPGAPPEGETCGHAREGLARGRWPEDPPLRTNEGPIPRLDQPMAWVVCGQGLGGQLVVDMAFGRTQRFPLRGRVELRELSFGKLLPRTRARTPMFGRVSGVLELHDGALMDPQTLGGALTLSSLSAGQLDVELKNEGPIEVEFGGGSFEVVRAQLTGPSSKLSVAGSGSLRAGLSLRVEGELDLSLLTSLSQTVTEASGKVGVGFNVSGMLDEPAIYGRANVRGAALKVASFPETVRDVGGEVTFSARRILLEGFSAKVAGGTIRWGGAAELSGRSVGSYSLQIEADGLALAPREGISLRLGGRGDLRWAEGQRLPRLTGRLRLDELVYTRPITMDRTLGDVYGPERAAVAEYDPENDVLAIDLVLEQTRPLFIRNNLMDAELRLENDKVPFRLVGTDQRFGVLGNMSIRKGTVRFRDRDFEVRQGDIHFGDETRIDPSFDIRATTDVHRSAGQNDWHIEIHAYGTRDQFRFDLGSEPYLAEDDIALLLTIGMTQSELAQLDTGDVTSTAALEALASVTGVESEVHKAVPQIDDFQIASTYSERSNRTEPQLLIGKRIANNVRLRATTGIAESRDFSTGVELQLDDKTSVQAVYNNQNATSASQVGDVGVDLKWRLEFD